MGGRVEVGWAQAVVFELEVRPAVNTRADGVCVRNEVTVLAVGLDELGNV